MLCSRIWVRDPFGCEFVCTEVKRVSYNNLFRLYAYQVSYLVKAVIRMLIGRQNERAVMLSSRSQMKGRWDDVHLAIPDQDISITAKRLHSLVLMDVFVISIEKISVTNHQVNYGIFVTVRICGIASKYVIDRATSVNSKRDLTITIKVCNPPRICQSLHLIAILMVNQGNVRIGISAYNF